MAASITPSFSLTNYQHLESTSIDWDQAQSAIKTVVESCIPVADIVTIILGYSIESLPLTKLKDLRHRGLCALCLKGHYVFLKWNTNKRNPEHPVPRLLFAPQNNQMPVFGIREERTPLTNRPALALMEMRGKGTKEDPVHVVLDERAKYYLETTTPDLLSKVEFWNLPTDPGYKPFLAIVEGTDCLDSLISRHVLVDPSRTIRRESAGEKTERKCAIL